MAIIGTTQDDEEKAIQQGRPTTSTSPNAHASFPNAPGGVPLSGGAGLAGGTGSGSGQGTSGGGAQLGGYSNLTQYLNANQQSGATTGQAASNVVGQAADAASKAQGQYGNHALGEINDATTNAGVNQSNIDRIDAGVARVSPGVLENIAAGGESHTGAYTGPTAVTAAYGGPTADALKTTYGGPTSLTGFNPQTSADQAAALQAQGVLQGKSANAVGGHSGVAALLKDAYAQPSYTGGENSLDAFLAGGLNPGGLARAGTYGDDATKSYANLQKSLSTGIDKGLETADKTNTAYKDAVSNAVRQSSNAQNTYNDAIKAAQDKAAAYKAPVKVDVPTTPPVNPAKEIPVEVGIKKFVENAGTSGTKDFAKTALQQTGGALSDMAKDYGGQIAAATKKAGGDTAAAAKKALQDTLKSARYPFAKGGEVPSYSKLMSHLGCSK